MLVGATYVLLGVKAGTDTTIEDENVGGAPPTLTGAEELALRTEEETMVDWATSLVEKTDTDGAALLRTEEATTVLFAEDEGMQRLLRERLRFGLTMTDSG